MENLKVQKVIKRDDALCMKYEVGNEKVKANYHLDEYDPNIIYGELVITIQNIHDGTNKCYLEKLRDIINLKPQSISIEHCNIINSIIAQYKLSR